MPEHSGDIRIESWQRRVSFLYNACMTRLDQRGFTLPELLVTAGLFVLLLVPVSLLLHPKDFGAQQRNAQRRLDAAQLVRAIAAYQKDNGKLPDAITTKRQLIGSSEGATNICLDLMPHYLKTMPRDPLAAAQAPSTTCNKADVEYVTGYAVAKTTDGKHVTVTATLAEAKTAITVGD
jgi:prepilin-type N-terminal cleavage/methylation domain-containing protein